MVSAFIFAATLQEYVERLFVNKGHFAIPFLIGGIIGIALWHDKGTRKISIVAATGITWLTWLIYGNMAKLLGHTYDSTDDARVPAADDAQIPDTLEGKGFWEIASGTWVDVAYFIFAILVAYFVWKRLNDHRTDTARKFERILGTLGVFCALILAWYLILRILVYAVINTTT